MSWQDRPCKPWLRAISAAGYGVQWFQGKLQYAHRVAFFVEHGRWPEPCCCHHCDNRPCAEPTHLFEGTRSDNMQDMFSKGRAPCKLTRAKATQIRKLLDSGASGRKLAARYGVAPCTISAIKTGRLWSNR